MTVGELIKMLNKRLKTLSYKTINNNIYEPNYLRLSSLKAKKLLGWKKILTDNEMAKLISDWYLNYEKENSYNLCLEQIKFYQKKFNERKN